MLHPYLSILSSLLLASALIPVQVAALDSLVSVLERMRVQEARHFRYRETRVMAMLAEPWKAEGDLYVSTRQMVIAQRSPRPVTTTISANRLLHIDGERNIRRSMRLERPFAVPNLEPFMQLLYGVPGTAGLEREYTIRFEPAERRWQLRLESNRREEHDVARMQVSGATGRGADRLVLESTDGDRTEWQLTLLSQGAAAERELRQIRDQLTNCQIPLDCSQPN
ncbi:MAG: LolA-related protein [Pseudomonadota bacterium]|nr:LolA-related protein [Pseudomonadota bacterium]